MSSLASARATVLVVDDTPQNLELLDECLSPLYRVKVANSGERALALCAVEVPDLIVLDVMMPGMDGFETLRRLKADASTRAVPVIFATAKGDKPDEHAGLQLGAADYITKPIHIPVLLARVKTQLALYEYQRGLERLVRLRSAELSEALKRVEKDERRLQASMARLAFVSNHDDLTGLSNRQYLMQRLGELMREALLDGGAVALAAINLDRFHTVNQALGVSAGDELLSLVAQQLLTAIAPDQLLARAGSDVFVWVSSAPAGTDAASFAAEAMAALERLLAAVRAPSKVLGNAVELTASAGLVLFPTDGDTPSEMLRNAELAVAAAKRGGRNRALRYQNQWGSGDSLRFEQEARLRRALTEQRFVPYYQPKVQASSGALVGAEALVRWPKDDGSYTSAGEFIPLAEECGLMEALDDLMIVSVMRQLALWGPRLPAGFRVAVNVSSNRFHDGQFPAQIRAWLAETGASAQHLELEITEGALIGDTKACAIQLQQLCALGIELTLDDFGTGYSSLSYLKQLPLQHLKVDQSFVRDIEHNANDSAIVRAVLALAGALNLHTVAEGVETLSQLKFLNELGCHTIQGFLFSPALSAEKFALLLAAGRVEMQSGR